MLIDGVSLGYCLSQRVIYGWPHAAYLVVADEAYGRAIPSAFLDKMASEFSLKYGDKAQGAKEGALNSSFG